MEIYNYNIKLDDIDESITRNAMDKNWCGDFMETIDIDKPSFITLIKLAYIIDFCNDNNIKKNARVITDKWKEYYSQE